MATGKLPAMLASRRSRQINQFGININDGYDKQDCG
jgi:hypothetical protein